MRYRQILFIRELQSSIKDECDICHEIKWLEYLAMDEQNTMLTICEDCCQYLNKSADDT
jgi:hypothetical protein